jgi:hypothetical protein
LTRIGQSRRAVAPPGTRCNKRRKKRSLRKTGDLENDRSLYRGEGAELVIWLAVPRKIRAVARRVQSTRRIERHLVRQSCGQPGQRTTLASGRLAPESGTELGGGRTGAMPLRDLADGHCHGNAIEHALRAKTRQTSYRGDGILPRRSGFGSEDPQCGARDEVALKGEGVVNRTVDAQKALGGSS